MPDLPPYMQEVVETLEFLPDKKSRLEFMMSLGEELKELPAAERVAENKVPGCVSDVHVQATLGDDGRLHFRGSSGSFIVKGYVRILLQTFDGWAPDRFNAEGEEIVREFLRISKLDSSTIFSRANALGNIFQTMKKQSVALAAK